LAIPKDFKTYIKSKEPELNKYVQKEDKEKGFEFKLKIEGNEVILIHGRVTELFDLWLGQPFATFRYNPKAESWTLYYIKDEKNKKVLENKSFDELYERLYADLEKTYKE